MAYNPDKILDLDHLSSDDKAFLNDLQGNILKGHGREQAGFLFFTITDVVKAKAFLKAFGPTSAGKQLAEVAQFKATCGKEPGSLFRSLFLTSKGYDKLGVLATKAPNSGSFVHGAQAQAATLKDPPVSEWETGFQATIHGMFLLAYHDLGTLTEEMMDLRKAVQVWGVVDAIEEGIAYKNANGDGLEHFGYVDGRSQPLMIKQDLDKEQYCGGGIDVYDPRANMTLAVVPDALGTSPNGTSYGSYFVFRKLEQNVHGFLEAEDALARKLQLFGTDFERAGAMVVGRYEDGTPLTTSDDDGLHCPVSNNFNYALDPKGLKCPLQAHIRKSNPRSSDFDRTKRMARRGITYGRRTVNPDKTFADKPTKDVGLLFMSYQKAINDHFEFIQTQWVNNEAFPSVGVGVGLDPVIGQITPPNKPIDQTWHPEYDVDQPAVKSSFYGFVTMKGGEYFFAPSISAIQAL